MIPQPSVLGISLVEDLQGRLLLAEGDDLDFNQLLNPVLHILPSGFRRTTLKLTKNIYYEPDLNPKGNVSLDTSWENCLAFK